MPGSVQLALPVGVLPLSLSLKFSHSRAYPVILNEYRDGSAQRQVQASHSRKGWSIGKRLTAVELDDLRNFFIDHRGATVPFYFYDPWETSPKYSHDASGAATEGRFTVRFSAPWSSSAGIALHEASIEILEVE